MTLLSFRVSQEELQAADRWAEALGVPRSELLRDALHRHLVGLSSEHDSTAWERSPATEDERSLASIAEWGPAEDWTDWSDAQR